MYENGPRFHQIASNKRSKIKFPGGTCPQTPLASCTHCTQIHTCPTPLGQKACSYSCYCPILSPCSSIDSVGVYANMQFYYKYEGWILLLSTLAPGYQSCSVCSQLGVWLTYIYALKSIVQIFVTLRNANIRRLPLPPTLLPLLLLGPLSLPPSPPLLSSLYLQLNKRKHLICCHSTHLSTCN